MNQRTQRLLQFATHLRSISNKLSFQSQTVQLVEVSHKVRIHYEMRYNLFVLLELPKAFPKDWSINHESGLPFLKTEAHESIISSFAGWFEVSPEEICHLLDIDGFQIERYLGQVITESSQAKDYAINFQQLALNS